MSELITTPGTWTRASMAAMQYDAEQQVLLTNEAVRTANGRADYADYTRSSTLIQRGGDIFAVFGDYARKLMSNAAVEAEDGRTRYEYLPALIDGQSLEEAPDEGRIGVLTLIRKTIHHGQPYAGEWMVTYIHTGWIRATEIMLPDSEISERIAQESAGGAG